MKEHWSEEAEEKMHQWLAAKKQQTSSAPPLAIFDCDNTCIQNDVGEAVFHFLVEKMELPFSEQFYQAIGLSYEAAAIQASVERLQSLAPAGRKEHPSYPFYHKKMLQAYYRRIDEEGVGVAYPWLVRLMAGMKEQTLQTLCLEAIQMELKKKVGRAAVLENRKDTNPLWIKQGLRPFAEILHLMQQMKRVGMEIWVVSASSRWSVAALLSHLQFPVDGFVGVEVLVERGCLTDRPIFPQPIGEGKAEVIRKKMGRVPNMVAGDSKSDYAMLEMATEIALFIDHGDKATRAHAEQRGWLVQKAFPV